MLTFSLSMIGFRSGSLACAVARSSNTSTRVFCPLPEAFFDGDLLSDVAGELRVTGLEGVTVGVLVVVGALTGTLTGGLTGKLTGGLTGKLAGELTAGVLLLSACV